MKKNHLWLITALLAGKGIFAQNVPQDSLKVQQLDEVVVSDSKFELKRENSGKTVIKITAEEMQRNQGRTVAEIINTKSGIEIAGSRGRDGDVLGVYARGGRGRQVLIIIDGVRVQDPSTFSAEYDLRLLSPNTIESIEIIKGAASTLYGTNAVTAVINITTKKSSQKKIAGNFETSVGTNQTADDQNYNLGSIQNYANVNGTLGKFNYGVDFSNRYKSGLSAAVTPENEEDIFSHFSTNVKLGCQFSESFGVQVYGNQTKFKNEYDASMAEAPNLGENEQQRVGLSSELSYGKGSIHLNTAFTDYESVANDTFGESITEGSNWVLDVYNKYVFGEQFHTVLGVNYIKDEAIFADEVDFTIVDPYANVVYVSDFGLNLNAGARLNTHSEYGNHFVYNVNPSYVFDTENGYIKLMGSYATSYITPNLTQLFGAFGGNPELEPEENSTIEGGIEFKLDHTFRISTVYFDRNETNAIGYDANFMSINVADEIDANGVEVEATWLPLSNFSVNANYTFTERKGDNAIRIPKHKANVSLWYQFCESTNASLDYAYTGERFDTDFNTFSDIALEPFSLLNFSIRHELIKNKLNVFVNADNLLNEDYRELLGFTTRGRNFRVGLNLNL
ncbi:TonB-dependent receptor plug domain-containing protein [Muricauda oceani]|uniref:TonB-dependent receptor n=1 Tax=Flagellimonas oceani TaxID=2698672 RepID=A0A6G7J2J7_9FLAO|nr:TonB-dependent receptor plug domain-containing protein [Allomuricauda oceani]MBW8245089.1 TonB-dependent receptor plug domain-containing protein [Allomuricauda oceani]QII44839.1 TonB-dependent receptor [Allomuricauda oceani]